MKFKTIKRNLKNCAGILFDAIFSAINYLDI